MAGTVGEVACTTTGAEYAAGTSVLSDFVDAGLHTSQIDATPETPSTPSVRNVLFMD